MIIKDTVNDRPALVAYLNDRFAPVDPEHATLIKVSFLDDEGGMFFATVKQSGSEATQPG